ncbi:intracellular short-chain-length polyhydroxyalkanoate depolymerase [Salirhabdus sp. Marseille-P4669]|uniref:intracellular short-chain-length polyhydroxyalkanoate depolymerase n=1 Tax=Salirhabdus sp. Marseille-P4669 TaxID=2042310 RepID=UPI000C7C90C0|nr:alpha/beta hydrolase [Salirhabdus sp. Marseille-P4669]
MTTMELKRVKLPNGETLGYRERNGGEKAVLFIHGNMTSSKHWDLVLESLDDRYTLYAVDLRGFGISSYQKPIHELKDFAEDVHLFVKALNINPYAIVGWSLGGAIALQYCSIYKNPCEKLLLLASGSTRGYPFFATGPDGLPDVSKRLETLEEVKADVGKTQAVQGAYDRRDKDFLKNLWNLAIYRRCQPDPEKYDEYLEDMMTQRNLAEVYQALNAFNISSVHNGLTEGNKEVANISIPVLVMWGNEDLVVTESMTKEIVEDLGDKATYVELPNCGHSPLIDNLDLLVTTMEDFLVKEANEF